MKRPPQSDARSQRIMWGMNKDEHRRTMTAYYRRVTTEEAKAVKAAGGPALKRPRVLAVKHPQSRFPRPLMGAVGSWHPPPPPSLLGPPPSTGLPEFAGAYDRLLGDGGDGPLHPGERDVVLEDPWLGELLPHPHLWVPCYVCGRALRSTRIESRVEVAGYTLVLHRGRCHALFAQGRGHTRLPEPPEPLPRAPPDRVDWTPTDPAESPTDSGDCGGRRRQPEPPPAPQEESADAAARPATDPTTDVATDPATSIAAAEEDQAA